MREATCISCGEVRLVGAPREPIESYVKRRPYCVSCGHKNRIKTLGGHAPNWKGGRTLDSNGYVLVWVNSQYLKEHRYIYEQQFGKIPDGYVIHHKDGNKQNNTIDNLDCLPKIEHDRMNPAIKDAWKYRWRKELV